MIDSTAAGGSLPRVKRALASTAQGVRQTTSRQKWFELAWRWLALVGALFILDLLFGLPVWLRWAGLLGQAAFLIYGTRTFPRRNARRGSGDEWAAREVEERHPEVDNALINAVQFERILRSTSPDHAELMQKEMDRAESAAAAVDLSDSVDRAGEKRAMRRLAGGVSAWVLLIVLFPSGFLAVMPRLFAPWMDDVTPPFSLTKFDVRPPGATVRYGESLNIAATVTGPQPESLALMTRTGATSWRQIGLDSGEPGRYSATLSDLRDDTWFFVAGGGARSARYRIHVVRPPTVQSLRVTYTYPEYTHKPVDTQAIGEEGIHGLMHTRVLLEVAANRPLHGGVLTILSSGPGQQDVEVTPDPKDRTHGLAAFAIGRSGTYRLSLTAEDGQTNSEAAKGKITLDRDQRPTVWVEYPGQDLLATATMKVPILVQAEDDNRVERLDLHRVINELGDTPEQLGITRPAPKVQGGSGMDLAALGLRPGDTITYYATAFDNEPDRPNIGETEPFTIKIVTEKEYEEALKQQREAEDLGNEARDIISAVKDLAERQQQIAQEMEQLQRQLAKNPSDRKARDKLAEMQKQQKALQEEARKLSEQLDEYAKSPSATDLERALKKKLGEMAQAIANAANGPMQGAQSGSSVEASRNASEAARRLAHVDKQMQQQIEKTIENLEKILPLYADLERFKALTDEQGQLVLKARQYQQKTQLSRSDQAKLEQLASQQNQIQQELKRVQEDLRQHAADAQSSFPKAAASALRIANEIGQRRIAELMQEGQDRFRQQDGPQGFQSAQDALRQMQAMIKECESCQNGDCKGELDLALSRSLGQSGLGNSLAQLAMGMGGGNGTGMGRGGMQLGMGGQRGGGTAMQGARAYMPSTQAMHGTGGGRRDRKQNQLAGQPAALSPADVEVIKNPARKPPRASDDDAARYPAEYRKLISKYFESVAESK